MEKNILNQLKDMKERPGVYFGYPSLTRLYYSLKGYILRAYEQGDSEDTIILHGFQEFVEEKYDFHTGHNWAEIIGFFSANDEYAFNNFYRLLDEFYEKRWSE